jgi:hypothetical protein
MGILGQVARARPSVDDALVMTSSLAVDHVPLASIIT